MIRGGMITKRGKRKEDMREVFAEAPKKKNSRWKTATGITLILVILLLGVIYACGILYFKDKFFTGTTINSIEASYDTVEEVEQIVASQVVKYRLLVKERGGYEDTIQAAPGRHSLHHFPPHRADETVLPCRLCN